MANANLLIRYRPVRIGWCIRNGNWQDLRRAMRLTSVFWGGKFNPIIPVGTAPADELVRRFRVDVLVDICEDLEIEAFKQRFKHIPWPLFEPAVFRKSSKGYSTPNFLDVSHVLEKMADRAPERARGVMQHFVPPDSYSHALVHCDEHDPLSDVMLATFGAYPKASEVGRDYARFIAENIHPFDYSPKETEPIPACLLEQWTPLEISTAELNWDRVPYDATVGFYAGEVTEFEDVLNYWNLRASDLNVVFLDPYHSDRLALLRQSHSEFIRGKRMVSEHRRDGIPVWSRSQAIVRQLGFSQEEVAFFEKVDGIDIIGGSLRPPLPYLSEKTVLASISERHGRPVVALQLPEKPFACRDGLNEEHFVISARNPMESANEGFTFWTPYVPELNDWYGMEVCFSRRSARSEFEGIGIIRGTADESLQFTSLKEHDLAAKLFELAGIEARPSLPGRTAARLISQLGGLQGCRVLKITGVRRLIKRYGPLDQFDRTEAMHLIANCDPVTHRPRFSEFENLFIESRDWGAKLKPHDVFAYLLEKHVFSIGLTLRCPVCELDFWIRVDALEILTTCELCGKSFDISRQLKDRNWAYRRSGLFGRQNNQEGSIPVAVTLQQLDTHLGRGFGGSLLLTNMSLKPIEGNVQPCETDIFVAYSQGDRLQIAVGECKDAGGQIELDDARKLAAVADAFPKKKFDVYIVFSKTAPFSVKEIEHARSSQGRGAPRVILLSDRELEPYFLYEKTANEFDVHTSAASLEQMARITQDVFFSPKRKVSKQTT